MSTDKIQVAEFPIVVDREPFYTKPVTGTVLANPVNWVDRPPGEEEAAQLPNNAEWNRSVRRWGPYYLTATLLVLSSFALLLASFWVYSSTRTMTVGLVASSYGSYEKSICAGGCAALNQTGVQHLYDGVREQTIPPKRTPDYVKTVITTSAGFLQKFYDAHGGASAYECAPTDDGYTVRLLFDYGDLYGSYKTSCITRRTAFSGGVTYEVKPFFSRVLQTKGTVSYNDEVEVSTQVVLNIFILLFTLVGLILLVVVLAKLTRWTCSRGNTLSITFCSYCCGCAKTVRSARLCVLASAIILFVATAFAFGTTFGFIVKTLNSTTLRDSDRTTIVSSPTTAAIIMYVVATATLLGAVVLLFVGVGLRVSH
ncbi:hypothetical protein ADEAN_000318400 [Angomonas deanei]|uniref:Uncharacterized protein n=1 Tax=Angomonas deanei TaxID=59799 RepID=A0A7G2C7J5_9TRYP|nr:hypothetical protein ADEAN_000318400 [Angomonas deanei]